jgi:protein phosphatase 1 regulatory subunit 11
MSNRTSQQSIRTSNSTVTLVESADNASPLVLSIQADVVRPTEGTRQHVTFSHDTIDNENMNKKSSKVCCIYKPKDDVPLQNSDPAQFPNAYER